MLCVLLNQNLDIEVALVSLDSIARYVLLLLKGK